MNARRLTVTASTSSPRGRVLLGALAALALVCATALAGSAPALAAECLNEKEESNESLRSEENSTLLPQCRAYEMVSPPYTTDAGLVFGFGDDPAPDGEAALFASTGAFADAGSNFGFLNLYIARRVKEVGWKTSWVGLPSTTTRAESNGTNISFDLTKELVRDENYSEHKGDLFVSDDLAAAPAFSFTKVTAYRELPPFVYGVGRVFFGEDDGTSADFSHVVVDQSYEGGAGSTTLYDLAGVGGPAPEPKPQPVGIRPGSKEILPGESRLGGGGGGGSEFHAISNDGSEIFFTNGGTSYVRVKDSNTLALGGLFLGASEDGTKVFLAGAGGRLFMDLIGREPGHEVVTRKVAVAPAGQSNTYLRSGDDGSHVYFNSTAVLGEPYQNENKEKAEAGKENLYVYDTLTEKAAFITQAVPGRSKVGRDEREAQVNGCPSAELKETEEPGCEGGRYFVFATSAKITPDDSSPAEQVFEYDARSGRLARVSIGEDGYGENGNEGAAGATIAAPAYVANGSFMSLELAEGETRAVSDDGSTVVFSTAQALSPRAVNDQQSGQSPQDVYEYHEGRVGLISTGHSPSSDLWPVIAPSGRDIFFMTREDVVPQDSDGLLSLYDARIDGGFPPPAVKEGGCTGDSCQGPPSVPNLLGAPASATFSGLGNPVPATPTPTVKPKPKAKPKACKKGYVKKRGKCVKKPKPKKKAKRASRGRRIK